MDSECILKTEPTGFPNTLDLACERKRGIKGDTKAATYASGGMALPPVEKAGRAGLGTIKQWRI